MAQPSIDVLGIGNAIVDVLAHADDGFLKQHDMPKGGMALIDEGQAEAIYADMGPGVEASGGSAANTIAGLASLGAKTSFIGKVRNDQLGQIFRHDLRALGVQFDTPAAETGPSTARCLVLVSEDGQRTMNTYLGACVNLTPDDIDKNLVEAAAVTYLEGYLFDPPQAQEAFYRASLIARAAGRKVSLSLSDKFCVDRYREEFKSLISDHVDLLFANEDEILALFEVSDLQDAVSAISDHVEVAAITLGAQGSLIISGNKKIEVPAAPVARVVDTTGAGDLYAAGVLYGYARGLGLEKCAELGGIAAAEIISHMGARPETSLAELSAPVLAAD